MLVLIRDKRDYFPKELQDLASMHWQDLERGCIEVDSKDVWSRGQGDWNIRLNKEEFTNLRTLSWYAEVNILARTPDVTNMIQRWLLGEWKKLWPGLLWQMMEENIKCLKCGHAKMNILYKARELTRGPMGIQRGCTIYQNNKRNAQLIRAPK